MREALLPTFSDGLRAAAQSSLSNDYRTREHFLLLPRDQQAQSIRRLSAAGYGHHTIAEATGLSVQMIRGVLSEAGD